MKTIFASLIFLLSELNAQWIQQNLPSNITALTCIDFIDQNIGVAGGVMYDSGSYFGVSIFTSNGGNNWFNSQVPQNSGFINGIQMIDSNKGYLTGAYVHNKGMFLKTINGGQSWNSYGTLPSDAYRIFGMKFINSNIGFISASLDSNDIKSGVLQTTNGGLSWILLMSLDTAHLRSVYTADGINIFACGLGEINSIGIIIKSSNGGLNWIRSNFANTVIFTDIYFNNLITGFAVCNENSGNGIIFKTVNSGLNWLQNYQNSPSNYFGIEFVEGTGKGIAVGTKLGNLLIDRTTNYGATWTSYQIGVQNNFYSQSLVDQNTWFVCGGMQGAIIYKSTNGGEIGIQKISNDVPDKFELYQNYPNPFNPISKIKFQISKLTEAKIKIFDALGREIQILVNEKLPPGTYETEFDGTNYPSGVYYYRLTAGTFNQSKKMVLQK